MNLINFPSSEFAKCILQITLVIFATYFQDNVRANFISPVYNVVLPREQEDQELIFASVLGNKFRTYYSNVRERQWFLVNTLDKYTLVPYIASSILVYSRGGVKKMNTFF